MAAAPPVLLADICPPDAGVAADACGAVAGGGQGQFTVAAAGELPAPPGGLVAVPEALRTEALKSLLDPAPIMPACILHVLHDVVVHPEGGIVFQQGRPLLESIPRWRRADIEAFLGERRFARGWKAGITATIDDPLIAVWNAPARNYSHWHYDGLAALTMAREVLGPAPRILAPPRMVPFQAASLALLPWSQADRAVHAQGLVRCRTLVWPSTLQVSVTPTPQVARAMAAIRAAVTGAAPGAPAGSRIYVARFDAPGRRTIDNEEQLAAALAAEGFDILTPGSLSYAEQVARFSQARIIIGPHGAGLTNAGFAPAGGTLVELHPAGYGGAAYARLAMMRGLHWRGWLMPESGGVGHAARCRVDVPAFLKQVDAWGALS
jgi:capsular polysaccharide biosynthesis protein